MAVSPFEPLESRQAGIYQTRALKAKVAPAGGPPLHIQTCRTAPAEVTAAKCLTLPISRLPPAAAETVIRLRGRELAGRRLGGEDSAA